MPTRRTTRLDAFRPLTVAMLIQRYYPHLGGAEQQLRALGPHLLERGIRPVVLTRRLPGTAPREELDGVPVYRVPARGHKLVAGAEYVIRSLALLRASRQRIDVLHAHELLSPTIVGVAGKWLTGRPLLVKVLRGGVLSDLVALRRRPLGDSRWRLYRRTVDRFIAISTEIQAELLREGIQSHRVACVPNGVDVDVYVPASASQRSALRGHLGLEPGPTAVFAGRLAPEKRLDTLLKVWPTVRQAVPGAQLLVIGDGPSRPGLQLLVAEGVRLLGRRDQVVSYLQASDLFVLPSAAEGLSNAMLEAMACGLPVVVHPHGGALDVVQDGRSGVYLPDATAASLASAIIQLLSTPARARSIGDEARRRVVERYSLGATADRLAELYRQIAKRPATCAE